MSLYQRLLDQEDDLPWHAFESGMRLISRNAATADQMGTRFGLTAGEKTELTALMAPSDVEHSIAVMSLVIHGQMTKQEGKDYFGI